MEKQKQNNERVFPTPYRNRKPYKKVHPGTKTVDTYTLKVDPVTGRTECVFDGVRNLDEEIQTSCGLSVQQLIQLSLDQGNDLSFHTEGPDIDTTSFPDTRAGWEARHAALQQSFDAAPLKIRQACGFDLSAYADMIAALQASAPGENASASAAPAAPVTPENSNN